MPAQQVAVTTLGVELHGTTEFMRQLHQMLANNQITVNAQDLNDRIKKAGKDFESSVRKTAKLAFSEDAKKEVIKIGTLFRDSVVKTSALRTQLTRAGIREEEKIRINSQLLTHAKSRKALNDQLKTERSHLEKAAKFKRDVHRTIEREADAGSKSRMVAFARGVLNVYSDLKAGKVGGIASGGLGLGSKAFRSGGAKIGGMGGGGAASAGKVVAGLGLAVGAIGGLVTAVGLLMKLFFDMDKQIKDTNKSLIKAGGAYKFLGKQGASSIGDLNSRLDLVRKTLHDDVFNETWMTMPKERFGIINAMAAAGVGMNQLFEGTKNETEQMQRLNEVSTIALSNARQMGMESSAVAKDVATYMQEMGTGLDETSSAFEALTRAASQSSFNQKRFYSTVLESTSGLFYYNQRLAAAAKLLGSIQKVLGEKAGNELFKSLNDGFAEMNFKSRFRQMKIAGKQGEEIMGVAAQNSTRIIAGLLDNPKFQAALGIEDKKAGVKGLDTSGNIGKQLAKLSAKEFATWIARFRLERGSSPEAVKEAQTLISARDRHGKGRLAQLKAMGGLVGGENLALKMADFQGGALHTKGLKEIMAFEEMTGISGKQLKMLMDMSQQFHGTFDMLKKIRKNSDEGSKTNKLLAKNSGVAVIDGKIVQATLKENEEGVMEIVQNGIEIKSANALIAANAKEINSKTRTDAQKQLDFSKQIVSSTEALSKILSIKIAGLLEDIRGYVKPLEIALLHTISKAPGAIGEWARKRLSVRSTADALRDQADNDIVRAEGKLERLKGGGVGGASLMQAEEELAAALARKRKIADPAVKRELDKRVESYMKQDKKLEEEAARDKAQLDMVNEQTSEIAKFRTESKAESKKLLVEENLFRVESGKHFDLLEDALLSLPEKLVLTQQVVEELARIGYSGGSHIGAARDYAAEDPSGREALALKYSRQASNLGRPTHHVRGVTQADRDARIPLEKRFNLPGVNAQDFIITNTGQVIRPSAQDAILGMKPGGPLAKAMGGRGSGGSNITVNIYESHDTQKTYNTVKRVLEAGGVI